MGTEQLDQILDIKYKLYSSDNFDEYMKTLGVGLIKRKLGNSLMSMVQFVRHAEDPSEYCLKLITSIRTHTIVFRLGEWRDECTPDGRQVKTIFTLEGNVLTQIEKTENQEIFIVRTFSSDEIHTHLSVDGVTCIRIFKAEVSS